MQNVELSFLSFQLKSVKKELTIKKILVFSLICMDIFQIQFRVAQ